MIYLAGDGFCPVFSGKEVNFMKMLHKNKSEHSIVTYVEDITIEPLYEDDQAFQRTIHIATEYGETLDLILYADERQKLEVLVPPEVYKGELDEEDDSLS
jgi:hypothetical protein